MLNVSKASELRGGRYQAPNSHHLVTCEVWTCKSTKLLQLKLLVRSSLRCSFCFRLKSECLCLETRPKRHLHLPLSLQCVDQVPLRAYHGTFESLSQYFAFMPLTPRHLLLALPLQDLQMVGDDFRFFPSEDETSPAASSDSLSSSLSRPGLRYRHRSHGCPLTFAQGTCTLKTFWPSQPQLQQKLDCL